MDKWCPQLAGTTVGVIRSVWAFDENNAWAVGASSTPVLKRNGTTWSPQSSSPGFDLLGVWGMDPNNVWAMGDGGTILKLNPWPRRKRLKLLGGCFGILLGGLRRLLTQRCRTLCKFRKRNMQASLQGIVAGLCSHLWDCSRVRSGASSEVH